MLPLKQQQSSLSIGRLVRTKKALSPRIASARSIQAKKNIEDLNAFSNTLLTQSQTFESVKTRMSMTIYDFNGSLDQFQHVIGTFLDNNALIVICVDASSVIAVEDLEIYERPKWETHLKSLLDLITFKTSKTKSFYLLPVITKCDKVSDENKACLESRVQNVIEAHLKSRLDDIRRELAVIELLPSISASQSDRLKNLVQIQNNLTPQIYKNFQIVSSVKMKGTLKLLC